MRSRPATVPGAPTIGTATPGNAQATVTWSAPASNGGSAITGYVVTPYIGATAQTATTVGNVLTTPITGLTNGTTYTFRVAAINSVGTGSQSANSNAVTPTPVAFRSASFAQAGGTTSLTIGKPTGVLAGDILIATVTVLGVPTITAPTDWTMIQTTTNGSALKQSTYFHVVTGSEGAAFSWTFATSSAAGGITAYSGVDVTAPPRPVDASGGQPTTGSTTNVVAPSIATNVTGDLLIGAFGSAINATFSPPAGMIERGEISSTKGKSKVAMELTDQILGAPGSTGTRTATTDKAAIGIGQLFALRPSGSQAPVTVPDAPTGLVATRGNETVTLSWSAPTHDGGSQITGYNVYRGTTPGGEGTVPFATSTSTDYTDNDVTNGVTYYYVIRAVNSIGAGSPSSEVSGTPATVPDAPATLTATGGQGTVHLTWTAANSGGSPVTNYKVYRATSSGAETLLTTVGNVTSWDDQVSAGTYYYRVSAMNAVGEGALSHEAFATATPPPALTVPSAPQNLSASPANGKGIQMSWAIPASNGGSPITGYRVYRGTASGGETLLTTVGNVTTFKDTSTTRGVVYYYKVVAVNSVGDSAFSNEASATAK